MSKQIKISICNNEIEVVQQILPNYLFIYDIEDQLNTKDLQERTEGFINRTGIPIEAAKIQPSHYTITIQAINDEHAVTSQLKAHTSDFTYDKLADTVTLFTNKAIECAVNTTRIEP